MFKKIVGAVIILLVVFFGYVSTRDSYFRYERSGVINASKEKIFPYISNLRLGEKWSPYDKPGMQMKKDFEGADGEAGSAMTFEGDESGSGRIEVLNVAPNEKVNMKLIMTKPFHAENDIEYILTDENGATRFTWVMQGDSGFIGKLISVLIDCEKMIGGQFEEGIANLKRLIESEGASET